MGVIKDYLRHVGQKGVVVVQMSFETGEQAAQRVYFPYPIRVTKLRAIATKALADTDAGTVTGANSTGNSTAGVLTLPLSSLINAEATAVTPTTNTDVAAGSYYKLTAAKTTAGGKAQVSIEYTRI